MNQYDYQGQDTNVLLEKFLNRYPTSEYSKIYPELYTQNFENFCIENIFPIIKDINNQKTKNEKETKITTISLCAIFFFIFIFAIVLFSFICFYLFLIFLFFSLVYYQEKKWKELQEKKNKILPKLFSLYKNCKYITNNEEKEAFRKYLNKLLLFEKRGGFCKKYCEDFFKLDYKGLKINLCELNLPGMIAWTANGDKLIHKGGASIFYRIKTKKLFSSKTFIRKRRYAKKRKSKTEELIILESSKFNNIFLSETTNQQEARTFLTPSFMEKLINFSEKNHHNEILISFEKGYINICFSAYIYSSFEIGDIEDVKNRREVIKRLRYTLIDLQEHLKLIDDLKIEDLV